MFLKRFVNPFNMTFWFITKVRTIGCSWKTNHISFFIICNPSVSGEDCSKLIQYIIYCIAFLDPRPLVALKANIVKAKMKSYWQQLTQNNMYGKFETFFFLCKYHEFTRIRKLLRCLRERKFCTYYFNSGIFINSLQNICSKLHFSNSNNVNCAKYC